MLKVYVQRTVLAAAGLLALTVGCRSRFVQATIVNDGEQPLQIVELDYPGASFGVSTLAGHGTYNYRFKALGSGPVGLSYTDLAGKTHSANGPVIEDGQAGVLRVNISSAWAVHWSFKKR